MGRGVSEGGGVSVSVGEGVGEAVDVSVDEGVGLAVWVGVIVGVGGTIRFNPPHAMVNSVNPDIQTKKNLVMISNFVLSGVAPSRNAVEAQAIK